MPRSWKKLAECADKEAFSVEDVCDRFRAALKKDWRKEIPGSLIEECREIVSDNQTNLVDIQTTDRLKLLRREAAGYTIRGLFLDNTIRAVEQGISGDKAIIEASRQVLFDYASRRLRQVEEHYLRESTREHATHVRQRIKHAIEKCAHESTGDYLLGIDKSKPSPKPVKKTGLDDGVQL